MRIFVPLALMCILVAATDRSQVLKLTDCQKIDSLVPSQWPIVMVRPPAMIKLLLIRNGSFVLSIHPLTCLFLSSGDSENPSSFSFSPLNEPDSSGSGAAPPTPTPVQDHLLLLPAGGASGGEGGAPSIDKVICSSFSFFPTLLLHLLILLEGAKYPTRRCEEEHTGLASRSTHHAGKIQGGPLAYVLDDVEHQVIRLPWRI